VVARINQDQVISPQITLWNQQGSEVIQGQLLVSPIEESLIYIRPLYLRSAGGKIPELKRVIVAYQNQIVMDETLDQALSRIFPPERGAPPENQVPTMATEMAPGEAAPAPAGTVSGLPPGASAPAAPLVTREELIAAAQGAYRRAVQAQRDGNWAEYGMQLKQLGDLLDLLAKTKPAPTPGKQR
jgi:hypothetical protein